MSLGQDSWQALSTDGAQFNPRTKPERSIQLSPLYRCGNQDVQRIRNLLHIWQWGRLCWDPSPVGVAQSLCSPLLFCRHEVCFRGKLADSQGAYSRTTERNHLLNQPGSFVFHSQSYRDAGLSVMAIIYGVYFMEVFCLLYCGGEAPLPCCYSYLLSIHHYLPFC